MFTVVLDACVLVPATLADTLLRIAETGAFDVRWSADILAEVRRTMLRLGASPAQVDYRLDRMTTAFPFAMVENYASLTGALTNDPKDRHVLAAAIRSGCDTIVTANMRDFPGPSLAPWGVDAIHPDDFLMNQLDLAPGRVLSALRKQAGSYRKPSMTADEVLGSLSRCGVPDFADECRRHLPPDGDETGNGTEDGCQDDHERSRSRG